jgi:hypothetical protein
MSYQNNPFVTNIVPLFNVTSSAAGSTTNNFAESISNLETLLDYNSQTLVINTINPYDRFLNTIIMNGDINIQGQLSVYGIPIGPDSGGSNFNAGTHYNISTGTTGLYMIDTQDINLGTNNLNAFQFVANNIPSLIINSNGNTTVNTLTSQQIFQKSDENFLFNTRTIPNSMSTLNEIHGLQFSTVGSYSFGITAQQLNTVIPKAVDSDTWSIDYSKIIPLMVESIKELSVNLNDYSTIIGEQGSTISGLM